MTFNWHLIALPDGSSLSAARKQIMNYGQSENRAEV